MLIVIMWLKQACLVTQKIPVLYLVKQEIKTKNRLLSKIFGDNKESKILTEKVFQ